VLEARLASLPPNELAVTIVSYEEQVRGWLAKLGKARTGSELAMWFGRLARQLENYCGLTVLDFDDTAAAHYDQLRGAKVRVNPKDLQIVAIALANDGTLLSRNLRDFIQVPGLKVEDWTRPPGS
jgi:tRNA(fMet)-specific endonuclease VapC